MVRSSCRRRRWWGAAVAVGLVVLTACGGPPQPEAAGAGGITEVNCGIPVSVPGPPQRVYALYQPAAEAIHALGLSDRLVGTSFHGAPVLPQHAEAQSRVPSLPELPSREALLATDPDFVLAGFNNAFASGGSESISTRADLARLGIATWINAPLCPTQDGLSDEAIDPAQVSMDTVYEDLRGLGRLFAVPDRADAVVADLQRRVADLQQRVAGRPAPRVAILLNDDDGSYRVASGIDFGTQVLAMAGAQNAFADLTARRHVAVSKEELAARDPDVILTSTCCDPATIGPDGASDVAQIRDDPALSGIRAVQQGRVFPFLFEDRAAGVRAPYAAERVADLVHQG